MQIHCETCGTVIPASNINIQEKLAVCPQCGSVFSFADHLARRAKARKIKPPPAYQVIERESMLEIRFRWLKILKGEEYGFVFLCAVGAVLLFALAGAMFADGLSTIPKAGLGVGAALAAFGCLYMMLVLLLNRVRITLDDQIIHTQNRPLPFFGHQARRAEVVQVVCEPTWYNRDDPDGEFSDYHVQLVCHDGSKTNLVTLRRDLAFYTAQIIETYLEHDELLPDGEAADAADDLPLSQEIEKERRATFSDRA
jgi:hypothetical protein